MKKIEIWKEIPDSEGRYLISDFGRLKTTNWKNSGKEAIMKPAINRKGYLHTVIIIKGKNKAIKIHRLVAEAFIDNPYDKSQVNHKDTNKLNNYVENLEWVTPKENYEHACRHCLCNSFKENIGKTSNLKYLRGNQIGTSKLTTKEVQEIRQKFKPRIYTRKKLAIEYGVTENCIKDILIRKSWKWL